MVNLSKDETVSTTVSITKLNALLIASKANVSWSATTALPPTISFKAKKSVIKPPIGFADITALTPLWAVSNPFSAGTACVIAPNADLNPSA